MRNFIFSLLCLLLAGILAAQETPVPEKVYVHLDRTCFAVGETIWLAGYVANAQPAADTSRFLYVELLDPDQGEAVLRGKIKRRPYGFAGALNLPDTLASGTYLLRAYTRWQLSWPQDRLFHVPVQIYGLDGSLPETIHAAGLDVSFYPEGGRYFVGEAASVGFKAMNSEGRGVDLSGKVVDDQGMTITTGRTLHEGMGLLHFTPEAGHHYRFVPDDGSETWPLPDPSAEGATLQVRRIGEQLLVNVINRTGALCRLSLCASGQESVISEVEGVSKTLRVELADLPAGLQKFRLSTQDGRILSERAVFRESGDVAPILLTVKSEGESYSPRTQRKVLLRLPAGVDTGIVSVSVVRHAFSPYQQEGGIGSYMLLGSELRGFIANPDYYFDATVPEKERRNALDLLLLIQGWTYYDFIPAPVQGRERMQSISGEVRGMTNRTPRKYVLSVMAPGLNYSQVAEVARGGRFVVDSLDFRDSTVFILNVTRDGTLQSYAPVMDMDPVAPASGPWAARWPFFDTRRNRAVPDEAPVSPEAAIPFTEGTFHRDSIQTLTVQADYVRIKSPFGSTPRAGAKTREQLGPYDHMNLLDYVLLIKPTFTSSTSETGGTVVRNATSSEFGDIKLCVNGIVMDWDLGQTIHVGDVEKLSISTRDSDSFMLHADGVVLVELSGAGNRTLEEQGSTRIYVPLGWQSPQNFYHPRYDRPHTWVPDSRNTIFWNPWVSLRGGRNMSFTYFTDDQNDGPYFLRVEGRTPDGRWISTSAVLE